MDRKLKIFAAKMFHERMNLTGLVEENIAKQLNEVAATKGWYAVQPKKVLNNGFEELVNWTKLYTDILVLIGDKFQVCLHKSDYQSSIC